MAGDGDEYTPLPQTPRNSGPGILVGFVVAVIVIGGLALLASQCETPKQRGTLGAAPPHKEPVPSPCVQDSEIHG